MTSGSEVALPPGAGPGLSALKLASGAEPRAVRQSIFAIISKVDGPRADDLKALLDDMQAAITSKSALPFEAIDMLHFCSMTVFDDDDKQFGPYLVFESNIDGSPREYINTICKVAEAPLHAIYSFCTDYTSKTADAAYLNSYLRGHIVQNAAAFVGNVGRSARRIRDELALVERIQEFLDSYDATATTPAAIVAEVRKFVRAHTEWNWVWEVPPRLSVWDRAVRWASFLGFVAALIALLPFAWLPGLLFVIGLRRREMTDPIDIPGPKVDHLRRLAAREDRIVQNHLASLCYVKRGMFRRSTLKVVLFATNLVARISTDSKLMGLDSLHFAHWTLIDNDRRLLFLTNYDGSWENYLDDFIDKTAAGLTAIWSNTLNFPRTRLLFWRGARDERNFKAIVRTTQAYTNLWYSAYPTLSVNRIENNAAICVGLARPGADFDARAWLLRF